MSQILFMIFMNKISRRSRGEEGVWFGNLRIASLLFAGDVVLLASSSQDLQHPLDRFIAECEAARMKVSSSKSEAMVHNWKKVRDESFPPQVEEFKYLGILFTSDARLE